MPYLGTGVPWKTHVGAVSDVVDPGLLPTRRAADMPQLLRQVSETRYSHTRTLKVPFMNREPWVPVKNWNLVNGRNVSSERSANFIHGSLLAIQLGGFRFISDKFRY